VIRGDPEGAAFLTEPAKAVETSGDRRFAGLSSRLLVLTVLFVMVAEVLVFVPSVSNFRVNWLKDKLATAQVAGIALSGIADVPRAVQDELLAATGAMTIAIRMDNARRLVAVKEMPPEIDAHFNLDTASAPRLIADAFETLLTPDRRVIRVIGSTPVSIGGQTVEIALDEAPLKVAMWGFARNIVILSLIISGITAALVYITLRWLIVRPMQRLGRAMRSFSENPEDPSRLIEPSARADEIGDAERGLAAMQRDLAGLLQQKRHLADLGLAVSKINHDLRNILASAQLFTDRLAAIPDTTVQRLAPKLVSSLDRALGYSQAVLAYGKAREAPPARRLVMARRVVEDVAEVLGLAQVPTLTFDNRVPPDLELDADADQMFRVALNLMRNAVQALEATDDATLVRRLTVTGERRGTVVALLFSDTGPGVPPRAREGLFKAFQGSTRPGGTGLGLAIAAELVRAHGGEIELLDQAPGATFRVQIPDRPVDLETARRSGKRGER
jgi:signal transduction histidine kinase